MVEIAETSVDYDRKVKAPLYARNGIRELWLVDLAQETITVYQDPAAGGYRAVRVLRRGDDVAPSAFPDRVRGKAPWWRQWARIAEGAIDGRRSWKLHKAVEQLSGSGSFGFIHGGK